MLLCYQNPRGNTGKCFVSRRGPERTRPGYETPAEERSSSLCYSTTVIVPMEASGWATLQQRDKPDLYATSLERFYRGFFGDDPQVRFLWPAAAVPAAGHALALHQE